MARHEKAIETGLDGYRAVIIALNEGRHTLTLHFLSQSVYENFRRLMRDHSAKIEKTGDWRAEVSFLNRNKS
jgi:hypothetical protein